MNGANGMSDIEGKVTRVGASERGQPNEFQTREKISGKSFPRGFVASEFNF